MRLPIVGTSKDNATLAGIAVWASIASIYRGEALSIFSHISLLTTALIQGSNIVFSYNVIGDVRRVSGKPLRNGGRSAEANWISTRHRGGVEGPAKWCLLIQ